VRKNPDECRRHQIQKYFAERNLEVEIRPIQNGYEILAQRFCAAESRLVSEPVAQLLFGPSFESLEALWGGQASRVNHRTPAVNSLKKGAPLFAACGSEL